MYRIKTNVDFHLQNPTGKYPSASILWERHRCYIDVTRDFWGLISSGAPAKHVQAPMDERNASANDWLKR